MTDETLRRIADALERIAAALESGRPLAPLAEHVRELEVSTPPFVNDWGVSCMTGAVLQTDSDIKAGAMCGPPLVSSVEHAETCVAFATGGFSTMPLMIVRERE